VIKIYTNEQYQVMLQKTKELRVKIEVLDKNDMVIDYIEGLTTEGSIDIKNEGIIRRNLNMTFVATNKTEINKNSVLSINKRLRVYIGIVNYFDEVEYFNCGIFIISNPEKNISERGNTISVKGYDKGYLFQQNPFEYKTTFEINTPVGEAIKSLGILIGETKFLIEDYTYLIPNTELQYQPDAKIESGIKDLQDMYMNYQIYYNTDGYLVYETIKDRLNDPIIWSFKDSTDFHINKTQSYNYDNVKNYIKVLGRLNETTSIQPKYEVSVAGLDNEFSIDNIEKKPDVFTMDKYFTVEQCMQKANYELEKSQNLANTITIETIPIYLINDVNKIIEVYDYDNDLTEKYLVDSVSIPLSVDSTMNITAHKLFN
jgi:hypothetical protein